MAYFYLDAIMGSNVLIVLGMHRSYTTLLSAWLHHCGIPMYDPVEGMVLNLYEDFTIYSLHEDFLKAHNMDWLSARAPFSIGTERFKLKAEEIWKQRSASNSFWGWKDPRTCVTYDLLWKELTKRSKLIVIYRHYQSVVDSIYVRRVADYMNNHKYRGSLYLLAAQWHFSRIKKHIDHASLNCWAYNNRCCLHALQSRASEDYLVVSAEKLPELEKEIFHHIRNVWGFPIEAFPMTALMQATTLKKPLKQTQFRKELIEEAQEILENLRSYDTFRG